MNEQELLNAWKAEERAAHIHGWDFSHIAGRYTEETDLPWDYRQIILERLTPEMELLELSIRQDGFTQPIVVWLRLDERFEVVDGFHRFQVGKKLGLTHLPCVVVNRHEQDRNDRIASTVRHNRARGKHQIQEMSKIVLELKRRNWSDAKIAKNLGMDPDEVLRLSQVGGLADLFKDRNFSEAWK